MKTFSNVFLAIIMFFSISSKAYTQIKIKENQSILSLKEKQSLDGKQKMKYELALDIKNSLIFGNRNSVPSAILKIGHKKNSEYNRDRLYNYRILGGIQAQFSFGQKVIGNESSLSEEINQSEFNEFEIVPDNNIDFHVGFGVETQIELKHIIFYYGSDFIYSLDQFKLGTGNIDGITWAWANTVYSEQVLQTLSVNPFVGFRFFLTERISLAVESSFNVGLFYNKSHKIDGEEFTRSSGIKTKLNTLRFLNVSYMF